MLEPTRKNIPHAQRRRSCSEMVGGAKSRQNQIPYLPGGWFTDRRTIIPKKFSHCCEGSKPHVRLPSLVTKGLGIPWESDLEDQWDLIIGLPEDWEKQRLQSWRVRTKFCTHQDPEERSSDPIGYWTKTTCSCWRASSSGSPQGQGRWKVSLGDTLLEFAINPTIQP